MSRIAKYPITIPDGVDVSLSENEFKVKGTQGELTMPVDSNVAITHEDGKLSFKPSSDSKHASAMSGTIRSIVNNMIEGVRNGYQKKLIIKGVGYRAQAQGDKLNLSLGFSHPVVYKLPEGITAQTPIQTEVIISGKDKQLVGQVAAEIRRYRPPEPYKGKGIRYDNETVLRKQAKKK